MNFSDINTLMLDLDGTLLGIADGMFENHYAKLVTKRFKEIIEPEKLLDALWKSTDVMLSEASGTKLVWETFAESFTKLSGLSKEITYQYFDAFYRNEFNRLKDICEIVPGAVELIEVAKERDYKLIMATNPVFLEIATKNRMNWAGLNYDDFLYVTHIENSYFTKPHAGYYKSLLEIAEIKPHQALMVGNDYFYDMAASALGIQTWITDRYLDKEEYKEQFRPRYSGSLMDLLDKITY